MTKPSLTKENLKKIGKVALYTGTSAAIAAVIAFIQKDPQMFGIYTPIVNVILVTLQQAFKTEE